MVSAWRNFKNIFSRPLFTIIFRPEMLKFHPYSILTGDTMVRFVIFCVLSMICPTFLLLAIWKCHAKLTFASFSIKVCTFFLFTSKTPDLEETYNTLSFYQIEPYKKGPSLVLPSSIARNSSAPNAKGIFQIHRGILEGCTNRARPSQPSLKNCQNGTF